MKGLKNKVNNILNCNLFYPTELIIGLIYHSLDIQSVQVFVASLAGIFLICLLVLNQHDYIVLSIHSFFSVGNPADRYLVPFSVFRMWNVLA